jgi:hypothetical protein
VDVMVQYKKPVSGGQQHGELLIDTNDPTYAAPAFKRVLLRSQSPVDELPQAVLKGCLMTDATCMNGKTMTMSVSLSSIAGTPKKLLIWGKSSFDPGNTAPTAISAYKFKLIKPSNAPNSSLEQDSVKQANGSVQLTLDPDLGATGLYRVTLLVWDDKDQQSPVSSELKIDVTQ